jgi:tRNA threonylcarbamoyladenosine biosynthesis protein TsaE
MPAPSSDERVIVTHDAAETRAVGAALAVAARAGDLLCVDGPLGAGKTQLAKGFGTGLGVTDPIVSPSFILMAEYDGRLPLFHLDLYRLDGPDAVIGGGLLDERERDGVTLIEWADRLGPATPRARLAIELAGDGQDPRVIRLRATDGRYQRYLEALP